MHLTDLYREHYRHECYANAAMLRMLASVPEANRQDPRFARAVNIADHLAACRINHLKFITATCGPYEDWFASTADFAGLPSKFSAAEEAWTAYLDTLTDEQALGTFGIPIENGDVYTLQTRIQIEQLIGHAAYHRGQVVMLVDMLGGETEDTDFVDWAVSQ
jgi:uncharacterized damage-inducible protein DinB